MTAQITKADLFLFPEWLTPSQVTGKYECVLGADTFGFVIDAASRTMEQKIHNAEGNVEVQSGYFSTLNVNPGMDNEVFFVVIDYMTADGLGFSPSGTFFKPTLDGPEAFDSCARAAL